ncbi:hypothetical protein DTO021C3_7372 [Paecilomyces variotii]|nr:hypothetical protein DTO021C3_7372 [Paecilomyces variotii]
MINEELLDQISAAIDTPLPMIKRLILPITAPAIPTMITLLEPRHSLQELSFSIDGTTRDIVTPISRLTRLEKLEIKFRQKTELFSRDLTSLKQLTLLQKLSIVTDSWYGLNTAYIYAMDWTDTDFDAAISHMPHLRHLELHVQCPLSVAAMASLSHHCRSLETCEMPQIFNFNMWPDRDEIWFPNLQELCIGGFDNAGGDQNSQTDPGKFAAKLKTKCPRLQDLNVGSEDPYTEAVTAAFNALD